MSVQHNELFSHANVTTDVAVTASSATEDLEFSDAPDTNNNAART